MQMYAGENRGRFPDTFATLMLTQDITPEPFICPSSQGERAPGETPRQRAANLKAPDHLSYVYVGNGLDTSVPRGAIVAYELMENHNRDGIHFLYADGHVEFHRRQDAEFFIAELTAGHNPPRRRP